MINRIIFCVETTRQANTDYAYIRETIRHYYADDKKNVIRRVCMESKTRYNSKAVEENIEKECAFSKHNHVIYCIDTDDWDTSADDRRLMEKIQAYCRSKGYDFVFFCRDVEDVYWGKRVLKTEKNAAVAKFRSSHAIERIRTSDLEKVQPQIHCSNILTVLDQYMKRKRGK